MKHFYERTFWEKISYFWRDSIWRLKQTKKVWQHEDVHVVLDAKTFECPDCNGLCVNLDYVQHGLLDQEVVKERIGRYQGERLIAWEYICLECDYVLVAT